MTRTIAIIGIWVMSACSTDGSGLPAGEIDDGNSAPGIPGAFASADWSPASVEGQLTLEPTPVDTVEELPGDYYRPFALPGQISVLSLSAGSSPGTGEYNLYRSCGVPVCLPETGTYQAVSENPAVGDAFITFSTTTAMGVVTDSYLIDALWRNQDDQLVALATRRVLPGGVIGAPFFLYRQPWSATGVPEPDPVLSLANELTATELVEIADLEPELADGLASRRQHEGLFESRDEVRAAGDEVLYSTASDGLCAYYQSLQQYYAIRALQCAYSVCYPLSPWYGYWAQYYENLAQSVCDDE